MVNNSGFKLIFIIVVFTGVASYALFRAYNLIAGPSLEIQEPISGSTVTDPLITIKGTAKRIAKLSLNNRQIFTDEEGRFDETLLLAEGYTILTVRTEDRFGRKVRKTIELIYQPPAGNPASAHNH
ncbi:MAG TPA: hypothetical protein VEB60_03000 [Candidatus Paceibacterota bacterium]|nr:hypothetical protein [Candidatus Paceibacterota bacterium]